MGTTAATATGRLDRRTIVLSALLLLVAIVGGVALVAGVTDSSEKPAERSATDPDLPAAQVIPRPGSGTAPKDAGDRGGWEQLSLFGLMLGAMAGIGVMIFRGGGRRARTTRSAWAAAGQADHDGATVDAKGR